MKKYLELDPWNIIENDFKDENNKVSESVFSLGNGYMGQRANFEEGYTGSTLPGTYMAGIYYPDKTRVGWWKNGYPEYFAKVLNCTNWIGIDIYIENTKLDMAHCDVSNFSRVLNMKEGFLSRSFIAKLNNGNEIEIETKRFLSIVDKEIGVIKYSITPLNFDGKITISPYLDGDIKNEDANYDEKFWDEISKHGEIGSAYLTIKTQKSNFFLCSAMKYDIFKGDTKVSCKTKIIEKEKFIGNIANLHLLKNEKATIFKYVVNVTSRDFKIDELWSIAKLKVDDAYNKGFSKLAKEQSNAWQEKWKASDIIIQGDLAAQQAIRFNIFQLNQTYTGEDSRLNIGPKGFTGEKYGGSTYWDTEAYCVPFYLSTADEKISKNLLIYRYKQLDKAKENARKLGYKKGALYPMVTMNGEECHNEWEITFEEIHRNGAIAYAIYNYVNYTGDKGYLTQYGMEVLAELSRFWEERVNYSTSKNKYVILGVTGPNEYENNVNNNWYTNRIAVWTMEYTMEVLSNIKNQEPKKYDELLKKLKITVSEIDKWRDITGNMYYATDEKLNIFLQQDGYMDKEQILVENLPEKDLPIGKHWSWDRILRSCFIKQADVLQGLYFLQHLYDLETIRKNYEFYEPRTVHESSLSPCIHSILASKLNMRQQAYKLYLQTSRLDLDNYNDDTEDGCHVTSMAGTWMSIVEGFGGLKVRNDVLTLDPSIPEKWTLFSFKIRYRGFFVKVKVTGNNIEISNESNKKLQVIVKNKQYLILGSSSITI